MTEDQKRRYLPGIRKVIVFRYLTDEALADMAEACEIVSYGEGDRVVSEGEVDSHLYAVLEGNVNVFVAAKAEGGKQVFICAIGEGDVFGEAGIFLRTARTADVISAGPSTLLRMDRDRLFDFIQRRPSAGIKILYVIIYSLLKKLREVNQELAFERKSVLRQDDIDSIVEEALRSM
jgi:CRP/FNR family cyclic AMP-dependent transcriptional regulator